MTGAIFVLAINMAIATTMAIAFFAMGHIDTQNRAANWLGLAFVLATLSFAGEYVLHAGLSDAAARLFIALTMLGCLILIAHGVARRYEIDIPALAPVAIFIASTVVYVLILDRPRADIIRQILYQAPYVLVSLLGIAIVLRSKQRNLLDILLMLFLALVALSFATKPVLAHLTGGVGAVSQDYATTLYAAISMASGGIAALLVAMTCLALVISDSMASLVQKAERDAETGLFNQTGFERQGARLIASQPHEAGHEIALALMAIRAPEGEATTPGPAFVEALRSVFGPDALIARLQGAAFGVLMPQASLFTAQRQVDMLRVRLEAGTILLPGPFEVSFGIAEHEPGESISDIAIRAHWALEEARRASGNAVRLAARSALGPGYGTR